MNPVFWFLVILVATLFWFLASFIFYPIGLYLWRIWKDTITNLTKDDKKEKDREE